MKHLSTKIIVLFIFFYFFQNVNFSQTGTYVSCRIPKEAIGTLKNADGKQIIPHLSVNASISYIKLKHSKKAVIVRHKNTSSEEKLRGVWEKKDGIITVLINDYVSSTPLKFEVVKYKSRTYLKRINGYSFYQKK